MLEAAVILAVGLPAIIVDYRSHRIPNMLVVAIICGACVSGFVLHGFDGLASAVLGGLVGLLCMLPLYLVGPMGAGDVKFMAAMGSLLGPGGAVIAWAMTLIVGAALAMLTLTWNHVAPLPAAGNAGDRSSAGIARLPYAAAIVAGALAAVLVSAPRT